MFNKFIQQMSDEIPYLRACLNAGLKSENFSKFSDLSTCSTVCPLCVNVQIEWDFRGIFCHFSGSFHYITHHQSPAPKNNKIP